MEKKTQRITHTLTFKANVVKDVIPNTKGHGFLAISKKYNVSQSNVKDWFKKKDEILATINNPDVVVRKTRNVPGGGRKSELDLIESQLEEWIIDHNNKGLVVKDKYIQIKAQQLRNEITEEHLNDALRSFQASKGKKNSFLYIKKN